MKKYVLKSLSATVLSCVAMSAVAQSWEDPAPAVERRAPQPQQQPQYSRPVQHPKPHEEYPVRQQPPTPSANDDWMYDLTSQHLDNNFRPHYYYSGAFIEETEFGDYGTTDIIEGDIAFRLVLLDGILWGSLDAWLFARGMYFVDNPGLDALPDGLLSAGVDVGMTWRFVNGWSTEIRAAPGMYSDVTEPIFNVPMTLNFYYAVDPTLSFMVGATVRPGWDIPVIPNIGFAWQPADMFRLELMCPKSRVELFPGHMFSLFATLEWRNVTYGLEDADEMPDELSLDDVLVTAGATFSPFGNYRLTGEVGTFLERELSADVANDNVIDLSKEAFFRITLGGTF